MIYSMLNTFKNAFVELLFYFILYSIIGGMILVGMLLMLNI